jgi:hypothetical protein
MPLVGNRIYLDVAHSGFWIDSDGGDILWNYLGMFIGITTTTQADGTATYSSSPATATPVPLTAVPGSGSDRVTPISYSQTTTTLGVQATNGVGVTFTLYDLVATSDYAIYQNGVLLNVIETDSDGTLLFSIANWGSNDAILIQQQAPPVSPNQVTASYSPSTNTLTIQQINPPNLSFPCLVNITEDVNGNINVTPGSNQTVVNGGLNFSVPAANIRLISFSGLNNGSGLTFTSIRAAQANVSIQQGSGANTINFTACAVGDWLAANVASGNAITSITDSTFGSSNAFLPNTWGFSGFYGVEFGSNSAGLTSVGYRVYDSGGNLILPRSMAGVREQSDGTYVVNLTLATSNVLLWDSGGTVPNYGAWSDGGVLLANFGTSYTGQAVIFGVFAPDGTMSVPYTPAVFELVASSAGTGIFGTPNPTLPVPFSGSVQWIANAMQLTEADLSYALLLPAPPPPPGPSGIILSAQNNLDGTATTTVTGSPPSTSHDIATQPTATPSAGWTDQGTITGNAALTFTLAPGLYQVRDTTSTGQTVYTLAIQGSITQTTIIDILNLP